MNASLVKVSTVSEYHYTAEIVRVIDGDTLEVELSLGFHIKLRETVRVYGINCPETRSKDLIETAAGFAAKDFALNLLTGTGRDVTLKTVKSNEKFGRYLATVTLCDGSDFGTLMIQHGHAKEYFGGKRE